MSEGVSVFSRACDDVTTMTIVDGTPGTTTTSSSSSTTTDEDNQNDLDTSSSSAAATATEAEATAATIQVDDIQSLDERISLANLSTDEIEKVIDQSLDSSRKGSLKNVSFPSEDSELVTGYLEPANPWECAYDVTLNDLITSYKQSCKCHSTEPLENVLNQLEKMNITNDRIDEFTLKNEELNKSHCEALEAILKRVQFVKIDLESSSLDDESAETLFDMFEYYESARHLNISNNCNIGARGWQACSQMIKKTQCLEQLDAKDIVLTQQHMNILKRPLQFASQLQILKLENCAIAGRAFVILVSALKLNTGLKELYLADNGLEKQDAMQLSSLLKINHYLQLLDVSNNNIGDIGAHEIINGLLAQTAEPRECRGLSILIMWNNHLTKDLSGQFALLLTQSKSLETLNIGQNAMSDDFLDITKDSLKSNSVLLQLGVQSTGMMLKGILALAEVIEKNETLQRIDLRDNNIQLTGLTYLSLALKKNTTVTQIDLDSKAWSKSPPLIEQYSELVSEIRGYCTRNEELAESSESSTESTSTTDQQRSRLSSVSSRKISLTCQTLTPRCPPPQLAQEGTTGPRNTPSRGRLRSPAPSPIPSPVASPIPSPSRGRFLVSRVSETSLTTTTTTTTRITTTTTTTINNINNNNNTSNPCFFPTGVPSSRFRVTKVEPQATTSIDTPINTNIIPNDFQFKLHTPNEHTEMLKLETKISTQRIPECPDDELNSHNDDEHNVKISDSTSLKPTTSVKTDALCEKKSNNEMIISKSDKNTELTFRPSLERLLGLFQNPGNFFSTSLVDKVDRQIPIRDGMMALGDKFQQYLRESRPISDDDNDDDDDKCNNKSNVPVSDAEASNTCDNIKLPGDSINIFNCEKDNSIKCETIQTVNNHIEMKETVETLNNDDDQAFNDDINEIITSMLDKIPVELNLNGPDEFFNDKTNHSSVNLLIDNDNNDDNIVDNTFLTTNNVDKEFIEITNQPRGSFQESVDSGIDSECSSVGNRIDGLYIPRDDEFFIKQQDQQQHQQQQQQHSAADEIICQRLATCQLDTKTVVDAEQLTIEPTSLQ